MADNQQVVTNILSIDVGIKNLALCYFSVNGPNQYSIMEWLILPLLQDTENANKVPQEVVCDRLIRRVHEWVQGKAIHIVLIENQPAMKNPVMKTIQVMIYGFFVQEKIFERLELQQVRLMSATGKLKLNKYVDETVTSRVTTLPASYNRNKKLSIVLASHYAPLFDNYETQFKDMFLSNKKKDDLSDCMLQGMAYMKEHGLWVPQTK